MYILHTRFSRFGQYLAIRAVGVVIHFHSNLRKLLKALAWSAVFIIDCVVPPTGVMFVGHNKAQYYKLSVRCSDQTRGLAVATSLSGTEGAPKFAEKCKKAICAHISPQSYKEEMCMTF